MKICFILSFNISFACDVSVEVGEQVAGAGPRLPLYGIQGSSLGREACWQLPILAETSLWPKRNVFYLVCCGVLT